MSASASVVVLDAGPLGLVSNPSAIGINGECSLWIEGLLSCSTKIVIPEIADYEVRRELLRANRVAGLDRLDRLCSRLAYEPLTTAAMKKAAQFWATARQKGVPTAPDTDLDADMILCGLVATMPTSGLVIATTNARHLSRFCNAQDWRTIT